MSDNSLSTFLSIADGRRPRLVRNSLKEQTIDLLRDDIVRGRIPPGTKLVEREVAELMGVSRAPVRDALMELEKEGLVETRAHGRYVIQLSERDVQELYQVRLALEALAVRLAARHTCPENRTALLEKLEAMREAVARKDRAGHVRGDVEMHWLLWQQADNRHLFKMLGSMIGPVFMFVANNADAFDWQETLELHEELVACVNAGDEKAAAESMVRHLDNAISRSLRVFGAPKA